MTVFLVEGSRSLIPWRLPVNHWLVTKHSLISRSGGRNLTLHDYHMKFPGNGSLLKTVDLSTKRPSSWHLFAPTRSHVKAQKEGHRRKKTEE